MIVLLTGENAYALRAKVRQYRDEFIANHGNEALELREGSSLSVSDLPQLFQGASLFSPATMIVIQDLAANKPVWEALPEHLTVDDTTSVVLVEASPDKRTRTYKWLQKNASIEYHELLQEPALVQWLQAEGRALNVSLGQDVARYLVQYVGTDQWRLFHELHKLSLVQKPISQSLIQELIEPHPQATAFELLDATIAGRQAEVKRLIAIVKTSEDAFKFVGLLTSQVYALAVCHAAGERPATTIAKDAGLHPYVASKTQAIARRISREKLSSIISTIAQLDNSLKSTGGDPWILVEASLIKIATR